MMETLSLRIEKELSDLLEALAKKRNISKSNLLRTLVTLGLQHAEVEKSALNQLLSLSVQNLLLSKKILGHLSEEKLSEARLESEALVDELLESLKK